VRLSAFDFVPFRPDPALSQPGKPGPAFPPIIDPCLPYRYGFGVNPEPGGNGPDRDLPVRRLCADLGIKILDLTAGSPYYNPHIQRPAAYPPSDGYQPPEDPLVGVARQIKAVRRVKEHLTKIRDPHSAFRIPLVVGSAYSYLQDYLPHVAQAVLRAGWVDSVGFGRMVLSYPAILSDAVAKGALETKAICRTFSDCTTAPRNGIISGCYPLDRYYAARPEAQQLKEIKRGAA
jgi:NADPH2 dehydrogenase